MKVTKQTFATFTRKKVPLANTIHHSSFIYNQFKKLNLCKSYSNWVINHLMSILISIFISGYHGKTTDFAKNSHCHRTTIAHFLNAGKWDDSLLSDTLKRSVIEIIYSEADRTGKPVFCIVDDTIASKNKAFVTGSASNWRCVFSTVPFKGETGLRASGSCGYAFL